MSQEIIQLAYILIAVFFYAIAVVVARKEAPLSWKQIIVGFVLVVLANWYLPLTWFFRIMVSVVIAAGLSLFSPKVQLHKIGRFRRMKYTHRAGYTHYRKTKRYK